MKAITIQVYGSDLSTEFARACTREADAVRVRGNIRAAETSDSWIIHVEGTPYQVEEFLGWLRENDQGFTISRTDIAAAVVGGHDNFVWADIPLI